MINIYNLEKFMFFLYIIGSYYILIKNPFNVIAFNIYSALAYAPINLLIIKDKNDNKEEISTFEMGHRLLLLFIGSIAIVGLFSKPVKQIITFKKN